MEEGKKGKGPQAVTRAVCASISKFDGSVMHELLSIRNELSAPGRRMRTRIAMLYTSRWFMLWVEGDDADVDKVLRIAAADPRIAHQKLLHRSRGPAQLLERIAVSTTQSPLRPTQYARMVAQLAERGARIKPPEIFRILASPCVAGNGDIDIRPTRHVALLSTEDNGPIDQLRKLGERYRTPVIYRRFGAARRHSADVGLSYVDLPIADGIGRVHLLPRRALEQPMVRQAIGLLEGMALLLGTQAQPAVSVACALGDCLHGRARQPTVYVFGPVEAAATACAHLLRQGGVGHVAQPDAPANGNDIEALLPVFGWRPEGRSLARAA